MIDTIIVPLDGSAWAEQILPHAAAAARAFKARVLLLRILEQPAAAAGPVDSVAWRRERKQAESYLETRAERLRLQDLDVSCEVGEGNAAREIMAQIHRHPGNLLVLGTHGRGEAQSFDLGSTAKQVLSTGEASILLLRTGDGPPPPEDGFRHVLVPLDGSPRAEWALYLATSVVSQIEGEVVLARVVPTPPEPAIPTDDDTRRLAQELAERQRTAAREYLDKTSRVLAGSNLAVRTRIEASPQVVQTLERIADEVEADLVVLSAHGCSGAAPWPYGSVSGRLLHRCTRPVLVFQDLAPRAFQQAEVPEREVSVRGTRPSS